MATKRSHSETVSQDGDEVMESRASGGIKRRKKYSSGKYKAKEGSKSFMKKRARNIERLLQRKQDLPAAVRNDFERELSAREADIAERSHKKKRSEMIARYHMVRFFERQKASRLVKQLRRQIEKTSDATELPELQKSLHIAEVDEAYTLYHPHMMPYIGLYRNTGAGGKGGDAGTEPRAKIVIGSERPPMWSIVEKTMKERPAALHALREKRVDSETSNKPISKARAGKPRIQPKERQQEGTRQAKDTRSAEMSGRHPHGEVEGQARNRRERRRALRQASGAVNHVRGDDDNEEGRFFEEL